MASISIKNFPDDLYSQLNERAQVNGRKFDEELIDAARSLLRELPRRLTKSEKLLMSDQVRNATPGTQMNDEVIRRAREEGRA